MGSYPAKGAAILSDAWYPMMASCVEDGGREEFIHRMSGARRDGKVVVTRSLPLTAVKKGFERGLPTVTYSDFGAMVRLDAYEKIATSDHIVGESHNHPRYRACISEDDMEIIRERMNMLGADEWVEVVHGVRLRRFREGVNGGFRKADFGECRFRYPKRVVTVVRVPYGKRTMHQLTIDSAAYFFRRNGREIVYSEIPILLPGRKFHPPSAMEGLGSMTRKR